MLRMRLNEGIDFNVLESRFGAVAAARVRNAFASYESGDFLRMTRNRVAFTAEGMLVSNSILSDVLEFGD